MLLWLYTTKVHYNARKVVETFELSRERYPELYIPFDKIRVVSTAYRDIGEFERATFVHRSTIESSFVNDANVSATLQDEGRFLRSLGFMKSCGASTPTPPQPSLLILHSLKPFTHGKMRKYRKIGMVNHKR